MRMLDDQQLALSWGRLAPMITEALDHGIGETTAHQLFMQCMAGHAQCWVHGNSVCITRFNYFPEYKQLQIVTVTGPDFLENGFEQLESIEEFARGMECRNVSVWGRPGWKRLLKEYKEPYTVLIKELDNDAN